MKFYEKGFEKNVGQQMKVNFEYTKQREKLKLFHVRLLGFVLSLRLHKNAPIFVCLQYLVPVFWFPLLTVNKSKVSSEKRTQNIFC